MGRAGHVLEAVDYDADVVAFEACVCMPQGASGYPQVAAVVFTPGSTGETSREVARAMFSQRYATLGDEDVGFALNEVPSAPEVEAAVAALTDRTSELRVRGLDAMAEGGSAFAGAAAFFARAMQGLLAPRAIGVLTIVEGDLFSLCQ